MLKPFRYINVFLSSVQELDVQNTKNFSTHHEKNQVSNYKNMDDILFFIAKAFF